MFAKERQDKILEIMKKQGYVTVKALTVELDYSTATVNRDLNVLVKQGVVSRSYGGAQLVNSDNVPLPYRYSKMRVEKRRIGQAAAKLVQAGDTIFIDGSTTTEAMAHFITDIKDIKVITCNMAVATYLSEHSVEVICLGGKVAEPPSILFDEDTVLNAAKYKADKLFFSTGGITCDGRIRSGLYALLHRVMAENSDKIYLLADHKKVNVSCDKFLFDLSGVDAVISDYFFPEETKNRFPKTQFVYV